MASLRPLPVMVLTPVLGEAATTSWPPWRKMGTVFEPIRPVPPITTIFIANLLVRSPQAGVCDGCAASCRQRVWSLRDVVPHEYGVVQRLPWVVEPFVPRAVSKWRRWPLPREDAERDRTCPIS